MTREELPDEVARLRQQAETLEAVRAALGHGADEEAWPPGLTLPEAVARLRAMPAEVERWAHDSGVHARRMGEAQERARKARDEERADAIAYLHAEAERIRRGESEPANRESALLEAARVFERGAHRDRREEVGA